MRSCLDCPPVGVYNPRQIQEENHAPRWKQAVPKKERKEVSFIPPVGQYHPLPVKYSLFENIKPEEKKSKARFSREERFKWSKEKSVPFYNVLSEWGMKDKLKKKDILSRVGSSLTHHSVYY